MHFLIIVDYISVWRSLFCTTRLRRVWNEAISIVRQTFYGYFGICLTDSALQLVDILGLRMINLMNLHIKKIPTPPPSSSHQTLLTSGAILQFNFNGILHRMYELSSVLHPKNILIACIQESKLESTKVLPTKSFPNYIDVRKTVLETRVVELNKPLPKLHRCP